MWQFIGLSAFLILLAFIQLIWPVPLPGLNSAPALLLLAGACVLYRLPLRRLYLLILILAFGFDLLLNDLPACLFGYALTLALPMSRDSEKSSWFASLGWMLLSVLIFDCLMTLIGSFYGPGAWRLGLTHLPWSLGYNLLAALLILPLTRGLISVLHYQRFEYDQEVRSGRLG